MKAFIDLPDFIFISVLFMGLFLMTIGNVDLLVILIFLICVLVGTSVGAYALSLKQSRKYRKR
ncbi:hypothetical protein ACWN6Y_10835 [Vagococcus teuberi]